MVELVTAANLLFNAPRFVSSAMDLAKRVRERDNEKEAVEGRIAAIEEDAKDSAEQLAQHAQGIQQLATEAERMKVREEALTRELQTERTRVNRLVWAVCGLTIVSIGALLGAFLL